MNITHTRKNKIVLSDYNFRREVELRLQLAGLSEFDVQLLDEVLCCSLSFPVQDLVDYFEVAMAQIITALDRIALTRLLEHDGITVKVDKDVRKCFDAHIQKFDDDFVPGVEQVLRNLRQLPIQVLPDWYAIPRTTDDIVESVIEKYLRTPKIYQAHLADLRLDSALQGLIRDVFSSEDLQVCARQLRNSHRLSAEQFEEMMLLLEHHFVCFLAYRRIDGVWEEVVAPMREWRDYLLFAQKTLPKNIMPDQVRPHYSLEDFSFVHGMVALLRQAHQQPTRIESSPCMARRLLQLGLCAETNGMLCPTEEAALWLRKQPQDQAMLLYRLPIEETEYADIDPTYFSEKNLRQVERELRRVLRKGWVLMTEFLSGMTEPLNGAEPITLRQKGKRWSYVLPEYSDADRAFVKRVLKQRLFEVGIVTTGFCCEGECFMVTPFGHLLLGD